MREYASEYDRHPNEIGLDGTISATGDDVESWAEAVTRWQEIGATHVSVSTAGEDVREVEDHLDRLRYLKEALAESNGQSLSA